MENFTPEYLQKLRIQHRSRLDENLVSSIKEKILEANLQGKTSIEFPILAASPWEKVIENFKNLGFWVGSNGSMVDEYDNDGNLVYWFCFNWYIPKE